MLCLLVGWFAREREETNIDAGFFRLWVAVDDMRKSGESAQSAWVRIAARATAKCIEAVFGPKLFTLKAAWISGALSLASIFLLVGIGSVHAAHRPDIIKQYDPRVIFISKIAFFIIAAGFVLIG